jgi:HEAT repeat protein
MEKSKASAPLPVRRYAAAGVKEIVTRSDSKADAKTLLPWALKLADDENDSIVVNSLQILRVLFSDNNADKIEPILKEKLKDSRGQIRITGIDVLTEILPKADYVKEHVLVSALKGKDKIERAANIRFCARLPESEDILNALYECAFDGENQIRNVAGQVLRSLGPKTLPLADKMLKKLQEGNTDSLPAILNVLRNTDEHWDVIEASLVKLLGNKDAHIRSQCLGFLIGHMPIKDETIQKMAELLDDSDKHVRVMAIRALHPFRDKPFVRDAVKKRRSKESNAGVKKLLDMFLAETNQNNP